MDINQERTGLEKKFYLMCEPVVQEAGYRLYDLEYISTQKLLRLYIQNPATGSVITEDVPAGALGIARSRQSNILGWVLKKRKGSKSAEAAAKQEGQK